MSAPPILALDQGTSSSRAILFADGERIARARRFAQIYPPGRDGWVEHDPEAIWRTTLSAARAVLRKAAGPAAAIGIANQRETVVIWSRKTGRPIYNAIVWQDRRTASLCERLRAEGYEERISARTGLLLDPYFSASKIAWLLDHVDGARSAAERGELAFGTIDSFLIWRLTQGAVHATDATNAARTLLFDIDRLRWDAALLDLFRIPASLLPEVRDSAGDFGRAAALGGLPICGVAGDQQAAAIGQCCFEAGQAKSTYGTGCFVLVNAGRARPAGGRGLLTTIGVRLAGETLYALEGSIFIAGALVQWLRDALGLIPSARASAGLARRASAQSGVYFVPAFAGLGAPWWDARARGAIFGLRRDTGAAEIVRAGLESVAYQTCDLLEAMGARRPTLLRVDGGMAANDWLMQFLADMTGLRVERPADIETTARGAALLALVGLGHYRSLSEAAGAWHCARHFTPGIAAAERRSRLAGWRAAVARTRTERIE